MYLRSVWRIFINHTKPKPCDAHRREGDRHEFPVLGHFILFNSFAPFTAPHRQAHRRYLRINNACATASKYKQRK